MGLFLKKKKMEQQEHIHWGMKENKKQKNKMKNEMEPKKQNKETMNKLEERKEGTAGEEDKSIQMT